MSTDILDVYLEGERAGELHRLEPGRTEFVYDDTYRSSASPTPLSHSMPLSRPGAGPRITDAWLTNLLSENEQIKQGWVRRFRIAERTPFGYLRHVGYDLAGAVQVVPHGQPLPTVGGVVGVTDSQIADEIRRLRAHQISGGFADVRTESGDDDIHLSSLSGQQMKFVMAVQRDGGWGLPLGRQPSTHIFKLGFDTIADSDVVEHVTMRASARLGIHTASTQIHEFDGELAVVVERFDRIPRADGSILRLHQEDACQALSVPAERKYESDGGPSIASIAALIRKVTPDRRDREASLRLFTQAIIFNLLTAGIDAHAKNYSFLLRGDRARMTPLYDLNSAFMLLRADEVLHKRDLAMRYGKQYKLRRISSRNLARAADSLGIERDELAAQIVAQASAIPDAFADVTNRLSAPVRAKIPMQGFVESLSRHTMSLSDEAHAMPSLADMPVAPPLPDRPSAGSGEVWRQGHYRNDVWVSGRYRHSPGR